MHYMLLDIPSKLETERLLLRPYEPGNGQWLHTMFRENIARSLQEITGHQLGPNQQAWLAWWRKNREVIKDVK